jgi:hypothetical protein
MSESIDVDLPLMPEEAQKRLQEMGATIMFEKCLTTSDTSGTGRIVIPKVGSWLKETMSALQLHHIFTAAFSPSILLLLFYHSIHPASDRYRLLLNSLYRPWQRPISQLLKTKTAPWLTYKTSLARNSPLDIDFGSIIRVGCTL